ncbi:MAG: CDP-glycerol glycerophosphotransferase family protein [Methanobacteriaceae archaeon]|nr:CDP-glycerol glycerophosphotransferase family protein [Methanobacteriaceae archaeon]
MYIFSYLIPKKDDLWIFGAWYGEKYADNSKYLFEYVSDNHPEIRAVWLTKNKHTLNSITKKGYESHLTYSLKGLYLSLRAKINIISANTNDLNPFVMSRTRIINLWHGISLKNNMFNDKIFLNYYDEYRFIFKVFPFLKKDWDPQNLYMVSSKQDCIERSSAFNASRDKIKITGQPRTDVFYKTSKNVPISNLLGSLKSKGFKIGIYMPTQRDTGKSNISFLFRELDKLDYQLDDKNIFLLIKLHFHHLNNFKYNDFKFRNIKFLDDDDIDQDIYNILTSSDFLITDYSSVYFDYLLLDKPIIFEPFDMEDYTKNDRGFIYEYNDFTPGPKVENWQNMIKCIDESINFPDKYKKERKHIKNIFHQYNDGKNCERVFHEILDELS